MLNELSEELVLHSIRVVGVNFDDDPYATSLEIADTLGIAFPTLRRNELEALGLAAPNVMPTTVILDPVGNVVGRLVGLQSRESILGKLVELGALDAS
jgi:thiol-disulfide isomerase/thioredoxin